MWSGVNKGGLGVLGSRLSISRPGGRKGGGLGLLVVVLLQL